MSDVRPLGLLLPEDNEVSAAAYQDPRNWPMTLLPIPLKAVPDEYECPGVRPNAFDQDGVGACVAFSGTNIKDAQEKVDQGAHLFNNEAGFVNYDHLKHGWGSFPGDGIPDVEGSYPQAFWELCRKEGAVDAAGRPWKISAWYSHKFETLADLAFIQQVLMEYGPVSVGAPWPAAWFTPPKAANDYIMPLPTGDMAGGHAYSLIGWKKIGGIVYGTFVNTWGPWGSPKGIFRFPLVWLFSRPLGPQIMHKVVDVDDPPAPPPPEENIVKSYDAIPRTIDSHVGAQVYKGDGTTPLVKISSGGLNLYSPCKFSATDYVVRITTGGVAQLGVLRGPDVTNIRPKGDCTAAVAAERKRWTDWIATAPK